MKRRSRLAALMATVMTMLMPLRAVAQEMYTVFDTKTGTLTFKYDSNRPADTETLQTYDVPTTNSTPGWINHHTSDITTVIFDETFAGAQPPESHAWFFDCRKLTDIKNIGNLNTANVRDMSYMFYNCFSLDSLDLSNFSTANVTNMMCLFYGCTGLTSLDLSSFNTANVTNMGEMFYNCTGLTSIIFGSSFSTANVMRMCKMFNACSGLASLDLSNFNTAKVTDMGYMFYNCSGLDSLDLSSFSTANVWYMSYMFYNCSSLTSITYGSNFSTAKVKDMSFMFYDCSALTSLDLSNFNTANVTDMGNMFYNCSGLDSLDLSSFNTANVTDMSYMFCNCSGLTSIYVSEDFTNSEDTSSEYMFAGCKNLKVAISFNSENTTDKTYANYATGYFTCAIKTAAQLNSFAKCVNTSGNEGAVTELFADINFGESDTFTPISNFTGTFNGQGHTISGLNFSSSATALFANNGGTVKNLGVVNATIADGSNGSICGTNSGTISGCYFYGSGNICGTNSGTVNNCYYLLDDYSEDPTAKTYTQFLSGEVAYLLNGSSLYGVWGQQLSCDLYPNHSDYKVIRAARNGMYGTDYWATFSHLNSNAELQLPAEYTLAVYNATVNDATLTLTKRADNMVAKGEGVLLKTDCEYVNAKLITDAVTGATSSENHLLATPKEAGTVTATTGNTLYRLTYNKVDDREGLGFYLGVATVDGVKYTDGSYLNATPGKAYLSVATSAATEPATASLARGFAFPGDDGETTGVECITVTSEDVQSVQGNAVDGIFDLTGRKVSTPTKGLYITNGKKVIIK